MFDGSCRALKKNESIENIIVSSDQLLQCEIIKQISKVLTKEDGTNQQHFINDTDHFDWICFGLGSPLYTWKKIQWRWHSTSVSLYWWTILNCALNWWIPKKLTWSHAFWRHSHCGINKNRTNQMQMDGQLVQCENHSFSITSIHFRIIKNCYQMVIVSVISLLSHFFAGLNWFIQSQATFYDAFL